MGAEHSVKDAALPHSRDLDSIALILVLEVVDDQISAITRFSDLSLLARFGLPRTLPPENGEEGV